MLQERLNGLSAAINALHLVNPAYAWIDRIHELMVVSRDLSTHDISSLQRSGSKNYVTEANYIEFDNVKVTGCSLDFITNLPIIFSNVTFDASYTFQVVTPSGNVLVEDLTLRVDTGSNLLITGSLSFSCF